MEKLNEIGKLIFDTFAGISYWIIAAVAIKEVLKSASKHDIDGVIKALIATAVSYGGIFAVTLILDMVREVMGK